MAKERRSHPRVQVSHDILFLTNTHRIPRLAKTVNLSLGGARIATPYCLINGQVLELTVVIDGRVVSCTGQVAHVLLGAEGPMVGVRFEEMSNRDRLHLYEHISHLLEH